MVARQGWEVILEPEVTAWIFDLPDDTHDRVEAAIDILAQTGAGVGWPLVDTITGSRHQYKKELRVGTCRILFAFDPARTAILLVAGETRQLAHLVPTRYRPGRPTIRQLAHRPERRLQT